MLGAEPPDQGKPIKNNTLLGELHKTEKGTAIFGAVMYKADLTRRFGGSARHRGQALLQVERGAEGFHREKKRKKKKRRGENETTRLSIKMTSRHSRKPSRTLRTLSPSGRPNYLGQKGRSLIQILFDRKPEAFGEKLHKMLKSFQIIWTNRKAITCRGGGRFTGKIMTIRLQGKKR